VLWASTDVGDDAASVKPGQQCRIEERWDGVAIRTVRLHERWMGAVQYEILPAKDRSGTL
jgi:hypothetical protein